MKPPRGNGYPTPVQIILPSVPDATASLLAHIETCPGSHLECYGKPKLERLRLAWIERKHHLETLLNMALEAERLGWRDAQGNPTTPLLWKPESTQAADRAAERATRAAEGKAYRERKEAGTVKRIGAPRSENPSKSALRRREQRARKKQKVAA